jgi:iron complex outermembrane receptor protein
MQQMAKDPNVPAPPETLARAPALPRSTTRALDFGDGSVPKQTYAARWQIDAKAEGYAADRLSIALGGQNIAYAGNFPYDVISPIGSNGAYWYGRLRYAW